MLEDLRANSWSLRPRCMVLAYRAAHFVRCGAKERPQQSLGGPAAGAVSHYHRSAFSVMNPGRRDHRPTLYYPSRLRRNKRMTWRTLLTLLSVRNGKRLADGIRGR